MYFDDDFSFFFLFGINLFLEYNPILSVLSLIMIYINSTSMLAILNYEYIAAVLLLIYVGAISILILFIIMMYQINETEMDHMYMKHIIKNNMLYTTISILTILCVVDKVIMNNHSYIQYVYSYIAIIKNEYIYYLYGEKFSEYTSIFSNINNISDLMYTYYIYPLIISAFALFFVVIVSINLILKHIG